MRLSGYSLSEISNEFNFPISTLSSWFKDITLSNQQLSELKARVAPKISRGRMNSQISIKSSRMYRERNIFNEAEKEYTVFAKDPHFMAGLALYWASGVKKGTSIQFTASDPYMILLIEKWLIKYLKLDESKIKVRNYGKSIRIYICSVDALRKVIAWQKLLIQYYKEVQDNNMHP